MFIHSSKRFFKEFSRVLLERTAKDDSLPDTIRRLSPEVKCFPKKKTSALHKPPPPCSAAKLIEMRRKVEEGLVFSCRRQIPMMNFARGAALLLTTPPHLANTKWTKWTQSTERKNDHERGGHHLTFICAPFSSDGAILSQGNERGLGVGHLNEIEVIVSIATYR